MADRPTGTVTFLFTDIEGSTQLWETQPAWMEHAFQRQEAILRQAIVDHGGYAYKMTGDAFQAAFQTAPDALAASIAAQRTLAAEAWGEAQALRVRMALHTGTVEERGDDYVGPMLNRLARLLTSGHGGQTLLTRTTMELVRDSLPVGIRLRDLGEHRLKDLIRPEHIYQVVGHGLLDDFPPLRTLDLRRNNLPVQRDALIGREREIDAVGALLRRREVGLVTLTGPGGTGKTRLSLQVAADLLDSFPDGVWFVDLSSIRDPAVVGSAIAAALGVREAGDEPLQETLASLLRDKQVLLTLDNFEQVVAAAPFVADLLRVTPGLKVLVTSRETLHVAGEYEFPVPPLALPDPGRIATVSHLTQYAAVALFIQRAQAVKPDFQVTNENAPAVAEICQRLDGLPLAIELAAARTKLFAPQALLSRLTHRLKTLTSGARNLPARQQTLRGAIDWSYDLLSTEEQSLFAQLGVFVGGCTLEVAEAVCRFAVDGQLDLLDSLTSLVDKSLVRQVEGHAGEPRFTLLETLREYALERLGASGAMETVDRRHAQHFLSLVETATPELTGPDQGRWFEQLALEHGNLRAAIGWALENDEAELAARLAGPLWRFWVVNGPVAEGRRWLERGLTIGETLPGSLRATMLRGVGALAYVQGDYEAATERIEASIALYQALEDNAGMAATLNLLGAVVAEQGNEALARTRFEQSLALQRELGDLSGIAISLASLGNLAVDRGDYIAARGLYEESLSLKRAVGDQWGIAIVLNNLGLLAYEQGDYSEAYRLQQESLGLAQTLGDKQGIATALEEFGAIASAQGQAERALRLGGAGAGLRDVIGAPLPPLELQRLEACWEQARQALGDALSAAAWADGQAMALEDAIAYALGVSKDGADDGRGP